MEIIPDDMIIKNTIIRNEIAYRRVSAVLLMLAPPAALSRGNPVLMSRLRKDMDYPDFMGICGHILRSTKPSSGQWHLSPLYLYPLD